jgi:hypothetical protein|tara:strand:- start:570 stop:797 length:228 start_codon:yes stop_codon:yes gene_type:complete
VDGLMTMFNNKSATKHYEKGIADKTITDSIFDILKIVAEQEIVSYCSSKGTYSFDESDFFDWQLERLKYEWILED